MSRYLPMQIKHTLDDDGTPVTELRYHFDWPDEADDLAVHAEPAIDVYDTWDEATAFANENVGGSVQGRIAIYRLEADCTPEEPELDDEYLIATVEYGTPPRWTAGPAGRANDDGTVTPR